MRKKMIIILSFISVILIISTILVQCFVPTKTKFTKPEFDKTALEGKPVVEKKFGYQEFEVGENYKVFLCGEAYKNKNKLTVYFTSPKTNTVYLKLRIYRKDKIIAETGLIKPNEYIKDVKIKGKINRNDEIVIKVMSYEKDTYYSMGVITLNTTVL